MLIFLTLYRIFILYIVSKGLFIPFILRSHFKQVFQHTTLSNNKNNERLRINDGIRASELRVLQEGQESIVMSKDDALKSAQDQGLDLIEISANAKPPVAKITDYGKFVYDQKKKQKEIKAKQHTVEVKNIQVKIGTGDADLGLKANRASQWLSEGHRVKVELYLRGRSKYMDKEFLHDRLSKVLSLLKHEYKIVEDHKKSSKGIALLIEPDKSAAKKKEIESTPTDATASESDNENN